MKRGLWLVLLLFVLNISCAPSPTATPTTAPTPTTVHVAITTATQVLLPTATTTQTATPTTPVSVIPNLQDTIAKPTPAAAPQNCEFNRTLQDFAPAYFGAGIGESPVWVVGFDKPTILHLGKRKSEDFEKEYGYPQKVLWVIDQSYSKPISLHGGSLIDNKPLWFQIGASPPTMAPVLDPKVPGIPIQHGNYAEFPSYLFVPKAGCYFLEAQWPEGAWSAVFAAGR